MLEFEAWKIAQGATATMVVFGYIGMVIVYGLILL